MNHNRILQGDCLEILRTIPAQSINTCVTSPPYWGLRDYGTKGQLGLEKTPEEYVANIVKVFREVRRILRKDGTLWLNLGDSYMGSGKGYGDVGNSDKQNSNKGSLANRRSRPHTLGGHKTIKPKDLIGIPWRVAFALQEDGWWLRQDIIWSKPNPMPESVTDRCTKAHEYIFLFSKCKKYYFDNKSILEPISDSSIDRISQDISNQTGSDRVPGKSNGNMKAVSRGGHKNLERNDPHSFHVSRASGNKERKPRPGPKENNKNQCGSVPWEGNLRNKRSVWEVTTKPFKEAHFATYPPDLIKPCILAGCPEKCCPECGTPYKNIINKKRIRRNELSKDDPRYRPNQYSGAYEDINGKGDAGYNQIEVVGNEPDCKCNLFPSMPGIVLDPFFGAGTTGLVADRLGRKYVGIELNPEYIKIAENRIKGDAPLFAEVLVEV